MRAAAVCPWPAIAAATQCAVARLPFRVQGATQTIQVGSVAVAQVPSLSEQAAACGIDLQIGPTAVTLRERDPSAALAALNKALRAGGHILGWRDEPFALFNPRTLESLATMERAACRFWGTLTLGAHATGFVRGADGRPSNLWIAQRAMNKATDPGLFDNLIGGGVPAGQTPAQALVREAFEEAGLTPEQVRGPQRVAGRDAGSTAETHSSGNLEVRAQGRAAHAAAAIQAHSVLQVHRDVPHGLQHEWLYGFDVELAPGQVPHNQDGEVAGFFCVPVDEAAALAGGTQMTVDAALVTLDFLLRHQLLALPAAVLAPFKTLLVQPPAVPPTVPPAAPSAKPPAVPTTVR